MALEQRSPNTLDAGPNSRSYQCPRAGLASVTSNEKSKYDITIVCVFAHLSVLLVKHNITKNGLGS